MPASFSPDREATTERPGPDPAADVGSASVALRPDQRTMWLHEQLDPRWSRHGLGFALRYRGTYDLDRLVAALSDVVERHPALRTAIEVVDGEPVQSAIAGDALDLTIESAAGWSDDELRERAERFLHQPYDFRRGPLVRFLGLEVGPTEAVLVVATHHLVSDLWSLVLLGAEIGEAYQPGSVAGRRPSRQRSFAQFVAAEQALHDSEGGKRHLDFWRKELGGRSPAIDLAPLAPPVRFDDPVGRQLVTVPSDLVERAEALAAERGGTLHDLVLAAYAALLHRYSGQSELVVGTFRANRSPRDVGVIGCYRVVQSWPIDVDPEVGFGSLLEGVADLADRIRPHQRVSLPAAFEAVPDSPVGRVEPSATFQWIKTTRRVDPSVVARFGGAGVAGATTIGGFGGVGVEPFDLSPRADGDLSLEAHHHPDGLDLALVHRTGRLAPTLVEQMGRHLVRLLRAGVDDPASPIGRLAMLDDDELDRLRSGWSGPSVDHTGAGTLLDLIDAGLSGAPDGIVFRSGDERLRRADLLGRVDGLATRLVAAGVRPGDRVGVHIEPGLDLPVVLVAILRLGAAYVALDPGSPPQRLQILASDAGVSVAVTDSTPPAWNWPAAEPAPTWVSVPDGVWAGENDRDDENDRGDESSIAARGTGPRPGPDDLAYISFTSGSTGRPKPVGITHANAVNYLQAMRSRPGFGPDDVILAFTGLGFDISVTEQLLPMVAGGSAVVAGRATVADPVALATVIAENGVTVVQTTPVVWRQLLDAGLAPSEELRAWTGGEHLADDLAKRMLEVADQTWNVYGPTETTVWCSAARVMPDRRAPIGQPIDNVTFTIVGPGGAVQPAGAVGELHIGGAGVGPGYLSRPEQTAAAFLPDPDCPGHRRYRTGDLVVQDVEGAIHYLGRVDDQIKLNGQRIEPGEVEAVLLAQPGVGGAAVVARDDQLVAFVVPNDDDRAELDPGVLKRRLGERLPVGMVPSHIEVIAAFPLTRSNKIDRPALRARSLTPNPVPFEAPRPGLEQDLAALWSRTLGVERIGRHDDFFELGGDSLLAAVVFAEIATLTGRDYPMAALFKGPTLAELAEVVGTVWRSPHTSLVAVDPTGTQTPFFSVSPFLISTLSYRLLADHLGPDQPLFAIQPRGLESDDPVHDEIEEMAAHYLSELRTVQPTGPYRIGGHCAGNWVAFEMALQLERAGEKVEHLVLVDWGPPGFDDQRPRGIRPILEALRHYRKTSRLLPALSWQLGLVAQRLRGRWSDDPVDRRVTAVRRAHAAAHATYRQSGRFGGDAMLVRSRESVERRDCDWHLRWQELIDGELEVREVPGTHATLMLEAEHTRVLAEHLSTRFDH